MKLIATIRQSASDPTVEVVVVTGGVFAFTALYYTRVFPLQVLSALVLIAVAGYWSYAIRRGPGLTWSDFKLTTHRLWLNVLIAAGLAIFGWFYFSGYTYLTRGYFLQLGFGGSLNAVLVIIAVSVAEELFFRGYLQNRPSYRYSMWQRVLITVLAIALYKNVIHLWDGMPLLLHIELLLVGILHNILPSLWMEWSGSLVGPLLLHVFWDLLVYAPMSEIPYWVI
jgi:membrane protease YdiL (CAAX protease family)